MLIRTTSNPSEYIVCVISGKILMTNKTVKNFPIQFLVSYYIAHRVVSVARVWQRMGKNRGRRGGGSKGREDQFGDFGSQDRDESNQG